MTNELPFFEQYKKVLERACKEFNFIFSPNTNFYVSTVINVVSTFVPARFSVSKIKESLDLLKIHKDEAREYILGLIDKYYDILSRIRRGENDILKVELESLVSFINQEIVDYICYGVAEELIHEKYDKMLDEYHEDLRYLIMLKKRHKSMSRYFDKIFQEKWGSDSALEVKVIEEKPVPHEVIDFGYSVVNPAVFDTHNEARKKMISEEYGIPMDKVDDFIDDMERENFEYYSGEKLNEQQKRIERNIKRIKEEEARKKYEEFMKKKKEEEE